MPTKTDRILGYLPSTFRALPPPSALHTLARAFGDELLTVENSLVSVMRSHWVDQADREGELINDLARIGSLYGLAPRPDEDVEEFREHLKRYVRTFLEGTVTVQGILRVTAEVLALRIVDDAAKLDSWWRRDRGLTDLVDVRPRADDAAPILALQGAAATGGPFRRAEARGRLELASEVDLSSASMLELRIDGSAPAVVDLAAAVADPSAATLPEIVAAIEAATAQGVAREDDGVLVLASPSMGAGSTLQVVDRESDAAPLLLGLAPRVDRGGDATAARLSGKIDHAGPVDLSEERYLRIEVDRSDLAEVDCAGPDPANTTLDQVRDAINAGLGATVASHDGQRLALESPTPGADSSVALLTPAAQDATERLFGSISRLAVGQNARPARIQGERDLAAGVDLTEESTLRLRIDGGAPVTVDCAGEEPRRTRPAEIVAAVNAAVGAPVATHDGRFVMLASPIDGASSALVLDEPPGDAAELVLGIAPRRFRGADPTPARVESTADLSSRVNLLARHVLSIRIDGERARVVDLRAGAADPGAVSLDELVASIDGAFGVAVASHDGSHLSLTSPTSGGASSVAVEPLEAERRRRFVTRAEIADDAAHRLLGFGSRRATGSAATPARIRGTRDLSRAVDLRPASHLRLRVDDGRAVEIDCAGTIPRATTLEEIVAKIEAKAPGVAAAAGGRLSLVSPSAGATSRLALEDPRAGDALDVLLDREPGIYRGRDGTRVNLTGTVDLSGGVDLPADGGLAIGFDTNAPVQVPLAGAAPNHWTLSALVMAINVALDAVVAGHDGTHLQLMSPVRGGDSRIELVAPTAGTDVTAELLGFAAPRLYRGAAAAPARVEGTRDLTAGVDLRITRYLRIAIDAAPPVEVDCAAGAADPAAATLAEIVAALAAGLGADVVSHDGGRIVLTSRVAGTAGRITLERRIADDARAALLGDAELVAEGRPAMPATIVGDVELLAPVDLSRRDTLRLAIDGGRPLDLRAAGRFPARTSLAEVVDTLNAAVPGVASATEDDRLRLTSSGTAVDSSLELFALRHLELVEYPPGETASEPHTVRHGDSWSVVNDGVSASLAHALMTAPHGIAGPTLVNRSVGWQVRLLAALAPGERVLLEPDPTLGVRAQIAAPEGPLREVAADRILVGPFGAQVWVPFDGEWRLSGNGLGPAQLQLNEPGAARIVRLRSRDPDPERRRLTVAVTETDLSGAEPAPEPDGSVARVVGRVRLEAGVYRLEGAAGEPVAVLRGPQELVSGRVDHVVAAEGPLHAGEPPVLVAREVVPLFDVAVRRGETAEEAERYEAVSIGAGAERRDALVRRIDERPSLLVRAQELQKADVLMLPRGRTEWLFLDCDASRFDEALSDDAHYAGGASCSERGVFDVSRFALVPPESVAAVFTASPPLSGPTVDAVFAWTRHAPGAFVVNLPTDLPPRFGGRFNAARFALARGEPELYEDAVTEPAGHARNLETLINAQSTLVRAEIVPVVPLGFEAAEMPFRKPRSLTLGDESQPARLFLAEEGIDGYLQLSAREPGAWGNEISVAARPAGAARFDVEIRYEAGRFEHARALVEQGRLLAPGEPPLPALAGDLVRPAPIGVLQAKAAGVLAAVTRDRAGIDPADNH